MKVNPHRTQKYNRHKGFHDYGLSAVTDSAKSPVSGGECRNNFFESYGEHVKGCRQETDKLLTDSL